MGARASRGSNGQGRAADELANSSRHLIAQRGHSCCGRTFARQRICPDDESDMSLLEWLLWRRSMSADRPAVKTASTVPVRRKQT